MKTKYVYGVWQQWYDCDGVLCDTLNSLWSSEKKAQKYAEKLTRESVNEYISTLDKESMMEDYGKTKNITIDDLSDDKIAECHVDYYLVYPHEVKTVLRKKKMKEDLL